MFSVWEGATLLPRAVFDATGGLGRPYFYAHEGIELAWRVWDQRRRAWYAGDLVANHPAIEPTRHADYFRLNARNRVWLAKRNLPWVLVPLYVGSWTLVQLLRSIRRPAGLRAWFGGWWEGWRRNPGGRQEHQVGNGVADDRGRAATGGVMVPDGVAERHQVRPERLPQHPAKPSQPRGSLAQRMPQHERPEPGTIQIAVYFADTKVNLYQMRQWYAPLAELAKTWPVAIITRVAERDARALDEAPVPAVVPAPGRRPRAVRRTSRTSASCST